MSHFLFDRCRSHMNHAVSALHIHQVAYWFQNWLRLQRLNFLCEYGSRKILDNNLREESIFLKKHKINKKKINILVFLFPR